MDQRQKSALAQKACLNHAQAYGTKVPKPLEQFFASGDAFKADGRCLPPDTHLPGLAPGSFRLRVTVPSWDAHCNAGSLDDAVVGPDGDWSDAKRYLPLFGLASTGLIVADLEDGAIAFFDEGEFGAQQRKYRPLRLAASLDAFLSGLVALDKANWEAEANPYIWEYAAESGGEQDDDD